MLIPPPWGTTPELQGGWVLDAALGSPQGAGERVSASGCSQSGRSASVLTPRQPDLMEVSE